jgi:alpha-ketoglutarate-dependent taurine dioxygenase
VIVSSSPPLELPEELAEALSSTAPLPDLQQRTLEALRSRMLKQVAGSTGHALLRGAIADPEEAAERTAQRIAASLGEVVPQDKTGTMVRAISDRGTHIGEGPTARYADSREGGNLHTDGAESPMLIDYFSLTCVRQATHGGALRLVALSDVVDKLRADHRHLLEELEEPFCFDRRGDQRSGEPPIVAKPIIFEHRSRLCTTYFRKYIELGHTHPESPPLTARQTAAMDRLDELLEDQRLSREVRLAPGDTIVIDNLRMFHGRSAFRDTDGSRRLLFRTWISAGAERTV